MTDRTAEITPLSSFLKDKLASKQSQNPRYSLRAFARDLGVSPGRLSGFMTGSSFPGKDLTSRILERLRLPPEEVEKLTRDFDQGRKTYRELGGARLVTDAEFSEISSWEYGAIHCLLETSDAEADPQWIAKRLKIEESVAQRALSKLIELNLLEKRGKKLVPTHTRLTTTNDIPSKALRDANRQALEHSIRSLEQVPPELREIGTITVAINPKNLARAKKLAREFRRKLASLLERGDCSEVYNISIEIVPVTEVRNPERE